jgi:hypothetical protein
MEPHLVGVIDATAPLIFLAVIVAAEFKAANGSGGQFCGHRYGSCPPTPKRSDSMHWFWLFPPSSS